MSASAPSSSAVEPIESREMFATILAVTFRILSNPIGNAFQKSLTNDNAHPLWVNFSTFALLSTFCLWPAVAIQWGNLPREFWVNSLLMGIFCASGNACLVAALQSGELSVLGPINAWKSIIGLIVAFVVLRELPSLAAFGGVALILVGSYFVLDAAPERFSFRLLCSNRSIRLRVMATVLAAIEAVFIKKVALASDASTAFYIWAAQGALFSALALPLFRVKSRHELALMKSPKRIGKTLAIVLCVGVMQWTTSYALARLSVGCALALFQLSTLVGVLLGRQFFHEQGIAKKLVGSCIMIGGSVLVLLN